MFLAHCVSTFSIQYQALYNISTSLFLTLYLKGGLISEEGWYLDILGSEKHLHIKYCGSKIPPLSMWEEKKKKRSWAGFLSSSIKAVLPIKKGREKKTVHLLPLATSQTGKAGLAKDNWPPERLCTTKFIEQSSWTRSQKSLNPLPSFWR